MIEGDRIQHRDYCPAWIAAERRTCPEHHTNEAHHPDGRACGIYPPAGKVAVLARPREHHDEAADALIVEALHAARTFVCEDSICLGSRPCSGCDVLDKITVALKAMGK